MSDIDRLEVTRTPAEWESILDLKVIDPDGWDRRNYAEDWAKPLTRKAFMRKASMSTICSPWASQVSRFTNDCEATQ